MVFIVVIFETFNEVRQIILIQPRGQFYIHEMYVCMYVCMHASKYVYTLRSLITNTSSVCYARLFVIQICVLNSLQN